MEDKGVERTLSSELSFMGEAMAPGAYEIQVVRVLSGLINLDLLITFCRPVSHVKRCRLVALLFNNHGCYLKCFECRCEGWFACPNLPPRPSGVPCFAQMLSFVDPSTVRAASSPTARPQTTTIQRRCDASCAFKPVWNLGPT